MPISPPAAGTVVDADALTAAVAAGTAVGFAVVEYYDAGLLSRFIDRTAEAARTGGYERVRLDGRDPQSADALADARTASLFGGRRLFIVRNAEHRFKRGGDGESVKSAKGAGAVTPPATALVVWCLPPPDDLRKPPAWRKTLDAQSAVVRLTIPKDCARLAMDEARRLGTPLEPDAARRLVDETGDVPAAIFDAVERLHVYTGGKGPVRTADVEAVLALTRETALERLCDAVTLRDAAAVADAAATLEDVEPVAAVARLQSRIRQLLALKGARLGRRNAPAWGAVAAGVDRWTVADLLDAVEAAHAADVRAKSERIDRRLVLDALVWRLVGR